MVSRRTLLVALAATSGGCLQSVDTTNESAPANSTTNSTANQTATQSDTSESMPANNTTDSTEIEQTGVSAPDSLSINYAAAQSVLTISGNVAVPNPCYEANASADVTGRQIQVTVTAVDTSDPQELCSQVISESPFSIRVPLNPPKEAEITTIVLDPPMKEDSNSSAQYTYPSGNKNS